MAASMWAYAGLVSTETRHALGQAFHGVQLWTWLHSHPPTASVLALAGGITLIGAAFATWFPRASARLLPALGLICASGIVLQLLPAAETKVEVWPIVLGGAAFFYLWWLAALAFDLVFVWHRYIRHSAGIDGADVLMQRGYQATVTEQKFPKLAGLKTAR